MAESNPTRNPMNRVGIAIVRTLQWMRTCKLTLMEMERKTTPMPITRRRTRKYSTLFRPETFEDELAEEGEAVTVLVSAGEALAHAKPTSTIQDRLNQEPLGGRTHKVPLHKRRLTPPPQDRPTIRSKALE